MEESKAHVLPSKNGISDRNEKNKATPTYNEVLHQIGEFGLYQILVGLFVGFGFAYGSLITWNFIFAVDIIEHRCWINECESIESNDFNADWLKYAIPYKDDRPDPCNRYKFIDSNDGTCSEQNFNRSQIVTCDEFIMKNNEQRLLSHLNMVCTGQNDKLPLLGIANMVGRTLAMFIFGLSSDKFGRLITIAVSATLGAIIGTLQALLSHLMSFEIYLFFEFLASFLSTGVVAAGYIFDMEWTTTKYRVRLINITIMEECTLPVFIIGAIAYYFADNFLAYRLTLALPGFLIFVLYFFFGESPQWLLAQNKCRRAIKSLSKAARINRKPLQPKTIETIEQLSLMSINRLADDQVIKVTMMDLLRQKTLAVRLLIVSLIWILIYFAYYGIFFESTKVHDNKYLSFILIGLADIPGNIVNQLLMDRIGRRWTIGLALPIFSTVLFASTQLRDDQKTIQLILFVISKAAITTAFNGYHTFSSEFWPTSIRGTCANIGETASRVGSVLASIAVLLRNYSNHLPVFLSVATGILGSVLIFIFLPETMQCEKLPDTIEEALDMGKTTKQNSISVDPEAT